MPVMERLLVVDDEEMNREVLSRRLARSGFEVAVACNGAEALRMVNEQPFDLILLDQMMPDRCGSEVLRELRKRHSQSDLPVIMVTGVTESWKVAEALEEGANDYVTKPVDFTVALARIRAQLARSRAAKEGRQTDPLTHLPNRTYFAEQLEAALARARGNPGWGFAVLFLDLDRFKLVNDSLGHIAGDRLLVELAGRISSAAESGHDGEAPLVARLGGDEFIVLANGIADEKIAERLAQHLLRELRRPSPLEGHEFHASASMGIALLRSDHRTAEQVMRDADAAMYAAKRRGRGHAAMFDISMRGRALRQLRLELDLRTALAKGELSVHYQPRLHLGTKKILGFEALARWSHPEQGTIEPSEFIPLAEDTGLIREIGLWVMREASRQIRVWRERWPGEPGLDVAVNVSPVQLRDPDTVNQVRTILEETGIEPRALRIEITESTVFSDIHEARRIMQELKALGVGLELDDFATGYSCLRHLCELPFDSIKIDRSFIVDIARKNSDTRELVRTIMRMAENLRLGVIAEGIEDEESADVLREMGCRFAQGHYYSRAVDSAAIGALLEKQCAHGAC
ncbi:MAG TPA: EAL domain-containing protein [Bryobacteraceae bacterium]|nr:EAL domain-containing protein [Bryobacteraceae bacterium]